MLHSIYSLKLIFKLDPISSYDIYLTKWAFAFPPTTFDTFHGRVQQSVDKPLIEKNETTTLAGSSNLKTNISAIATKIVLSDRDEILNIRLISGSGDKYKSRTTARK